MGNPHRKFGIGCATVSFYPLVRMPSVRKPFLLRSFSSLVPVARAGRRLDLGISRPEEFDSRVIHTGLGELFVCLLADRLLVFERFDVVSETNGRDGQLAAHLPDVEVIDPLNAVDGQQFIPKSVRVERTAL